MIFEAVKVDTKLPSHTGVDLRQQCSRQLSKGYTTLVGSRAKAAHITDHPPTQIKYQRMAVGIGTGQRIPDLLAGDQIFLLLTGLDPNHGMLRQERLQQWITMLGGTIIGNDENG